MTWGDDSTVIKTAGTLERYLYRGRSAAEFSSAGAGAIQAAVTEVVAENGGGLVFVPAGSHVVTSAVASASNVMFVGEGHGSTEVRPSGNFPAFRFNGANNASRVSHSGMEGITVSGNGATITRLVESIYADRMVFDDCEFNGVVGIAFYGCDLWDTTWNDCRSNNAGSATKPAFHFVSTDTGVTPAGAINGLVWNDCTFETFTAGIWVEANGGASPNSCHVKGGKFESTVAVGNYVRFNVAPYNSVRNVRFHLSGGAGGMNIVKLTNFSEGDFTGCRFTNSGGVAPRTGVSIDGGSYMAVDAHFDWSTAPSVASMEWLNSPANVSLGNITAEGVGTLFSGTPGSTVSPPIRRVGGVPDDGDFPDVPLNGTMALDTVNHRLYIRDGAVWRYATLT